MGGSLNSGTLIVIIFGIIIAILIVSVLIWLIIKKIKKNKNKFNP